MAENHQIEVEVKVLLGEQSAADAFIQKLTEADPELKQTAETNQLNHYFDEKGDPARLVSEVSGILRPADLSQLQEITSEFDKFTLRTRFEDGVITLVVKAAKAGEDEQHAVTRVEGDYVANVSTIEELDQHVLASGYGYLSKWSRRRKTYRYKDLTVCLDKNAGYGYLAEFERVVRGDEAAEDAKEVILDELAGLGLEELPQDRLGRMFAFYNEHWPEYYQTDKTFIVE